MEHRYTSSTLSATSSWHLPDPPGSQRTLHHPGIMTEAAPHRKAALHLSRYLSNRRSARSTYPCRDCRPGNIVALALVPENTPRCKGSRLLYHMLHRGIRGKQWAATHWRTLPFPPQSSSEARPLHFPLQPEMPAGPWQFDHFNDLLHGWRSRQNKRVHGGPCSHSLIIHGICVLFLPEFLHIRPPYPSRRGPSRVFPTRSTVSLHPPDAGSGCRPSYSRQFPPELSGSAAISLQKE